MTKRYLVDQEDDFSLEAGQSDNKEILRFIGRLFDNWYWFALSGILGLIFAFFYLRYTTPQYKVYAKILVSDDKKGGGSLSQSALGDLSGLMGAKNSVDNEVEVLKTADLMREMVLAEEAYINYFNTGDVNSVPVMEAPYKVRVLSNPDSIRQDVFFRIKPLKDNKLELIGKELSLNVSVNRSFIVDGVGAVLITKNEGLFPEKENYGVSITTVRKTVTGLMGSLEVGITNKLVSTIDLTLQTSLPRRGERWLNTFIQKYVDLNLHDKNIVADSTLSFISTRLDSIKMELASVENRISGFKQSSNLTDISEHSKVLIQNSADFSKNLAEVETQLSMLDAMSDYLGDSQNPRIVPSSVMPQDVAFNSLVNRYNELVLQRERLLMANTEENPLVQNVTEQIAGLRRDMISNVASTRRQLELARNNQSRMVSQATSQIQRVPSLERGYIDLARLQQIKQAQYIFLQEKWDETAIGRTANISNSKVIDTPKAESEPFNPKRKIIYAIGLMFGLAIPLAILFLRDLLNVRVRSLDDLERYNKLPILGMVSHSDNGDQVVVSKTSRSAIAEQFRAIRTNLEFSLNGGKRILFSSSMSGEGKSYVALNLAVSLALLNKKVLLMELDLRKPTIVSKLGLPSGKGFSHYIVRPEMRVEEIIIPSGTHELVDLIQAGAIPPNPAELLIHERAQTLMSELADRYDYILMDAPPIGMVTDAQLLSRYADTCLYLVRQDFTYKGQLRIPNDLVEQHKIKPIQLVFNDIQSKGGYYSNYGYGYGYGYGDYVQDAKPSFFGKILRRLKKNKA